MKTAQVILDIPTRALEDAFSYEVPPELVSRLEVGCCVRVDFNHRPALGYVLSLQDGCPEGVNPARLKSVVEVLSEPFLTPEAACLARWIAHEYVAPLSEAVHLFTPPGASPRLVRDEEGVYRLKMPQVKAVDDRWASLTEMGRSFVPKRPAVKQRAIIDALANGEMRVAELSLSLTHISATLKALEKQGVIRITKRRRIRGSVSSLPTEADSVELTAGQAHALDVVDAAVTRSDGEVVLIDGVTGSGKTEVYLRAIRHVLEAGRTACVLVPEISLTPQTVGRFRARFGDQVAVLHSRLSAGERFDQWDLIRSGTARVAVGARSALFAPFHDLGLIVIDEEHEGSYKQGSSPRYLTRDVAAEMARISASTLVLGSASPAIETLQRCQEGEWCRVELPERACGKPLPPVQVVDLARELHAGNRTMFSRALREALDQTIERGEKAVLLLNQRGFASFLLCRDCGFVPECAQCSVSLTYHAGRPPRMSDEGDGISYDPSADFSDGYLMCHHCGHVEPMPRVCPSCGSRYLKQLKPGTEHAAEQLRAILPEGTPIVRMDADTTRGKDAHEKLLEEFMAADAGVLLGTQMIAKGLDFPDVTLVGVLIADITLKLPDFRAPERTFQLLEQVSGRAGRAEKDGRVIIQTYWPTHYAIRAAAAHDREAFLSEELPIRRELAYPPYRRLGNIVLWGKDEVRVKEAALERGRALRAAVVEMGEGWQVLGPAPCLFARLRGEYRWHVLVKSPVHADLPGAIEEVLRSMRSREGVSVSVDIDPVDLF